MSDHRFIEAQSADPVERAIAAQVLAILRNPTLSPAERASQVRQAQRALRQHQQRRAARQPDPNALQAFARQAVLPKGGVARSVQVVEGRVQIGFEQPGRGFGWLDAGLAPAGVASNVATRAIQAVAARTSHTRPAADPITARRRELRREPDSRADPSRRSGRH